MKNFITFWLQPDLEDDKYLQSIIHDLGEKYAAPLFFPHLTLYGSVSMEINQAKDILNEIAEDVPPFEIRMTKLNYTELFFKTVFIEFEMNEYLRELNNQLTKKLHDLQSYEFKPHISLIYKETTVEVKKEIINSLDIKNTYLMNRISIQNGGAKEEDLYNVKNWKIEDEIYLRS